MPAVGQVPGPWQQAPMAEIVLGAPYFPSRGIIPALEPMRDLLRCGRIDAGMSGGVEWKSVLITEREYTRLVEELRQRRPTLRTLTAPAWVRTMTDWNISLDELFDRVPAKLQREYAKRIAAVRAKLFAAMERKDEEAIALYTNQEVALQAERQTAIEKFTRR